MGFKSKNLAFTLAEVLITLGVIGVVAAMTLPTVVANYQKTVTVKKLKKAYTTLLQVVQRSYIENEVISGAIDLNQNYTANEYKNFFDKYFLQFFDNPKVFKNNAHPYGETQPYKTLKNSRWAVEYTTMDSYGRVAFCSKDGIFYLFLINSVRELQVVIDINGTQKPNMLGKDVFMFKIDLKSNNIVPAFANDADLRCKKTSYGDSCAAKIIKDGWKISDDYPW